MAAGGSDDLSKSDLESNFLCCPLCLEVYNQPRALDCLHSFCEDCLVQCVAKGNSGPGRDFPCPMCRNNTRLPPGGVQQLRINFVLKGLADWAGKTQGATPQKSSAAVIQEYSKAKQQSASANLPVCPVHHRQCELFCQNNSCQKEICTQCVSSHAGHILTTVEEQTQKEYIPLIKSRADINAGKEVLLEELRSAQGALLEINTLEENVKSDINKQLQGVVAKATAKADALKSDVAQALETERAAVKGNIQRLNGRLRSLEHTAEVLEQIMNLGSLEDCRSTGLFAAERAAHLLRENGDLRSKKKYTRPAYVRPDLNHSTLQVHIAECLGSVEHGAGVLQAIEQKKKKKRAPGRQSRSLSVDHDPLQPMERAGESHARSTEGGNVSAIDPSKAQLMTKFGVHLPYDKLRPCITGLCLGPHNCVAVLDAANKRVKMYGTNGNWKLATTYEFTSDPQCIIWYGIRKSFLLGVKEQGFFLMTPDGHVTRASWMMRAVRNPLAVVRCSTEDLMALGQHHDNPTRKKLSLWRPDGSDCLHSWIVSDKSTHAATVGDLVFVSATVEHCVRAYSLEGQQLWTFGTNNSVPGHMQLDRPEGICCLKSGTNVTVFVADKNNNRILLLDTGGKAVLHLSSGISQPCHVDVDPSGHLVLWDSWGDNVQVWHCVP